MNNLSLLKLWLMCFIFVIILAIFVQFFLLPCIFPSFHAGDGLLKGGDWIYFHHLALDLSQKIKSEGWSAWELRPEGQAPAGIAAAIYTLTVPKPWTLIPLNAALHATAAIILLLIILQFIDDRKVAFLAILPFVFFPSAMTWYTQIHKDGYFILGNLLFLYGWLLLIEIIRENGKWQEIFIRVLLIELGTFFIWLVRPYGVQIIQGLTFIINVVISILLVCLFLKKRIPLKKMLITILLCWMVLVMITPFTKGGIDTGEPIVQVYWVNSRWIPDFIESKFYHLSKVREGYSDKYQEAGSNIDINIHFHSMNDIFGFIPRAMEIILFAPFPNDWLGEGTTDWNTIMRRISGFEMIIVYISLFSLIFFMINNWRNVKFWLLLYFCMGMMLIYGLTIPNIGSLYRVRYGFLLTVVAFGWVELTFFFRKKSLL